MTSAEGEWTFPDTLKGHGYAFNKEGQLRKLDAVTGQPGDEPFEFNVSQDQSYNQKRYEALGDAITEHVYGLLETELELKKVPVPKDAAIKESAVIFVSSDLFSNPERLLVLIPGSGVVKSGQWARSLIINDSLKSGTQIPFIKRARELGYAILVMNPNDNERIVNGTVVKLKESQNAEKHVDYVWKHYVQDMNPKHVAVIAHSYGGFLTVQLAGRYLSHFQRRVFAIAFTDSVHNVRIQKVKSEVMEYLRKVARNWVAHDSPLDTPVPGPGVPDIPRVSAGHTQHGMTSWSSFESVFKFLQERYNALVGKEDL
ncbi:FAM172 family protein homolog CG10038 isoform X2 [Periplaneta americana]